MAKTNTKPTGRPKGSKNKVSTENRELLEGLVKGYLESTTVTDDISMLSPKERTDFMSKLHSITAPKVTESKVDMSLEDKHPHRYNLNSKEVYEQLLSDIEAEETKNKENGE